MLIRYSNDSLYCLYRENLFYVLFFRDYYNLIIIWFDYNYLTYDLVEILRKDQFKGSDIPHQGK